MTNRKPLVKPYSKGKRDDQEAISLGRALLDGDQDAIVLYRRKKWKLSKLVQYLASRVHDLERNQCKPSGSCVFKGRDYLYELCLEELADYYDASDS